jgi:hypothetical protein
MIWGINQAAWRRGTCQLKRSKPGWLVQPHQAVGS